MALSRVNNTFLTLATFHNEPFVGNIIHASGVETLQRNIILSTGKIEDNNSISILFTANSSSSDDLTIFRIGNDNNFLNNEIFYQNSQSQFSDELIIYFNSNSILKSGLLVTSMFVASSPNGFINIPINLQLPIILSLSTLNNVAQTNINIINFTVNIFK